MNYTSATPTKAATTTTAVMDTGLASIMAKRREMAESNPSAAGSTDHPTSSNPAFSELEKKRIVEPKLSSDLQAIMQRRKASADGGVAVGGEPAGSSVRKSPPTGATHLEPPAFSPSAVDDPALQSQNDQHHNDEEEDEVVEEVEEVVDEEEDWTEEYEDEDVVDVEEEVEVDEHGNEIGQHDHQYEEEEIEFYNDTPQTGPVEAHNSMATDNTTSTPAPYLDTPGATASAAAPGHEYDEMDEEYAWSHKGPPSPAAATATTSAVNTPLSTLSPLSPQREAAAAATSTKSAFYDEDEEPPSLSRPIKPPVRVTTVHEEEDVNDEEEVQGQANPAVRHYEEEEPWDGPGTQNTAAFAVWETQQDNNSNSNEPAMSGGAHDAFPRTRMDPDAPAPPPVSGPVDLDNDGRNDPPSTASPFIYGYSKRTAPPFATTTMSNNMPLGEESSQKEEEEIAYAPSTTTQQQATIGAAAAYLAEEGEEAAPGYNDNNNYNDVDENGKVYEDSKDNGGSKKNKPCGSYWLCLFSLAIIIAVVVIAVLFTRKSNDEKPNHVTTSPNATQAPTPSPEPMIYTIIAKFQTMFPSTGDPVAATVALNSFFMAVGSPLADRIQIYQRMSDTTTGTMTWQIAGQVIAAPSGVAASNVGYSLAMTKPAVAGAAATGRRQHQRRGLRSLQTSMTTGLLVGAPTAIPPGATEPQGGVLYYEYSATNGTGWNLVGSMLTSDYTNTTTSTNAWEGFGASVATATSVKRIVVGAPWSNVNDEGSGKIYVFEYTNSVWTALPVPPQQQRPNDGYGTSVDISQDGSRIAVGAPGGNYIKVYSWDASSQSWTEIFTDMLTDQFGSSVVMISDNYLAVGAPVAQNNTGLVRVYQYQSGTYNTVGDDIVGEIGDRLGFPIRTVSGMEVDGKPVIIVRTNAGTLKRFDFDTAQSKWVDNKYKIVGNSELGVVSAVAADGPTMFAAVSAATDTAAIFDVVPAGQSEMTSPPTLVPTIPPANASSTTAPTTPPRAWNLIFNATNVVGSSFGSAVAIGSAMVAAGLPTFGQTMGGVQTYKENGNTLLIAESVAFTDTVGNFGSALSFAGSSLVVGAPTTTDSNGNTFGSCYVYDRSSGSFTQKGTTMRPGLTAAEASGNFGAAVTGARNVLRVACGAPASNFLSPQGAQQKNGRVYIFEFNQTLQDWSPLGDQIIGKQAGYYLGRTLSMSIDGSRLLVGAPGGELALYYEWTGTNWTMILAQPGTNTGEIFGSSVAIISDDANTIAIGGPLYGGGSGVIRVYKRNSVTGMFAQVGPDIVGATGERLGEKGTLAGSMSRVVVGTATGKVRVLAYNMTANSWDQVANEVDVGSKIVSLAADETASSFVVGTAAFEIAVYRYS